MTRHEDELLVDYLFDELSGEEAEAFEHGLEADAALQGEVSSLAETLGAMRALEPEEPPAWLSSKVMAEARQVAEATQSKSLWARLRRIMWGPVGGLVGAGALAVMFVVAGQATLQRASAPVAEAPMPFEMGAPPAAAQAAPAEELAKAGAELEPPPPPLEDADAPADEGGARLAARSEAPARRSREVASPAPRPAPPRRPGVKAEAKKTARADKAALERITEALPAEPTPTQAQLDDLAEAPAPATSPTPGAPRAPAAEPSPVGGTASRGAAGASAPVSGPEADEQLAQTLVQAAWSEKSRGEVAAARRVLSQGETRLAGKPAVGWIYLARARLERDEGRADDALTYARRAVALRGFRGHSEAVSLVAALEGSRLAPASDPR
ncbi:MAG: hypothetical protein H6730_09520 [Deltaproteobacteria bacterium]|nr:hypothetical protein [Deltaproteobacteria bacterium]